jgi:hypothetical protein
VSDTDVLDRLSAVMSDALDVDFADLGPSTQRDVVGIVARLAGQAVALDAKAVAAFDASAEWAADGHRTVAVGVRHESNQSQATARRRVQRARKLRHLDHLLPALAAGEITTDAVDLLLRADRPGNHDAFVEAEEDLVDAARHLDHVDLVTHVRTWMDLADPDGADKAADECDDERSVHASATFGGQVRLDGWLTPVGGREWLVELERLEQELFEADGTDARDRLGGEATVADLARTPAQRRHDALIEMARRSAAYTGVSPAPRGRVVVNLFMDYETFCAELARHDGRPYAYPQDRTCELDDGTVITPSEALGFALGGEVRRIVIGADGHVLDYGRSRRLFTPALADAIRARDRRCRHPGCLLPAAKCETDHRIEWQHGGTTDEDNGESLCRFHNLWKTNNPGRWRTVRDRDDHRPRPPPRA